MCIYIYPVALRASPRHRARNGPQNDKNYTKQGQQMSKNHTKLMPGGVPEALGKVLGPFWPPGAPGDENGVKNGLGDPPPGTQL